MVHIVCDNLRSVLMLAQKMSVEIGCLGVLVDAKPEAVGFYKRAGFIALDALAGQLGDRPATQDAVLQRRCGRR